jgi:hypothetical protein
MSASVVNMAAILKTLYPSGVPLDLTYNDRPLLAMMKKSFAFYGENAKVPLKYANSSGRSAAFATAQSNANNVKSIAFTVTRDKDYAVAKIQNELILAARNNAGAFVEAVKFEMDGAMGAISNALAYDLYRAGSGVVGQIDSGVTLGSTNLQLRNPDDVVAFEVGQKIQLADAASGGTLRSGTLTIVTVNRISGLLTVNANISTISGATVNDYIVIEGDYDSKIKGLQAWVPDSAPSSTPFFGVNRTIDSTRLGGLREDFSALPAEEALIEAAKLVNREGGKMDHVFCSYDFYASLEKSLGAKVQYIDMDIAKVNFRGILFNHGKGVARVIPDTFCPSDRVFGLQMDTWELKGLGPVPQILDMDGLKQLRVSNDDATEIRLGYYAQATCMAPGYNINFKV